MELKDYWYAISEGWRIVVVALLAALMCAAAYLTTQSVVYTSSTQFLVSAGVDGEDPDQLLQRNALAQQRVETYVAVIKGDVLQEKVQEAAGADFTPSSVQVTVVSGTAVIDITATANDAEQAQKTAAAYADVAPTSIEELVNRDDSVSQVEVSVIDRADRAAASGRRSPVFVFLLAGMVGIGLGVALAAVWWVLRQELTSEDSNQDDSMGTM